MQQKQRIFLSDNDGTLTVARKPIRGEMAETLVEFSKLYKFAIVTGSPYKDMVEQMPPELLNNPNIDYWCCMGNILYNNGKELYNSHNTIDFDKFAPIMQDILQNCPLQYHKSFPRHHEINANCAINFTMLGRPEVGEPSMEDRAEYVAWDNEKGQRKWIIDTLVGQHPEYNFTYGGQISVDIVKRGAIRLKSSIIIKTNIRSLILGIVSIGGEMIIPLRMKWWTVAAAFTLYQGQQKLCTSCSC